MADLVSGRYPQQNPSWVYTGAQNNLAQTDVPVWTNYTWNATVTDGASVITKEEVLTPVAIPWGTAIEKISLANGATETETLTHAWVSVRAGTGGAVGGVFVAPVIAKSSDKTALEAKKVETISFTLEKSLLITPENAPFGYVYIGVYVVAAKAGTYATVATPAAALFKAESALKVFPWFANMPMFLKTKPTVETEPEKEPKEAKAVAVAPVLFVQ